MDESSQLAAIIRDGKILALTSKGYLITAPLTQDGGSLNPDSVQPLSSS